MNQENILESLKKMVLNMDVENAESISKKAVESGANLLKCCEALTAAVREVGKKYESGEYFLPDLIFAAEVLKIAMPIITENIRVDEKESVYLGKVVIGTVFGDVHDIGKNLVSILLSAAGFNVIDLGINVKAESFLESIRRHKPDILAMSALLTTTASEQEKVIKLLVDENFRKKIKIIVGGGPIDQNFADRIGADGYGATAPEGVKIAKKLLDTN